MALNAEFNINGLSIVGYILPHGMCPIVSRTWTDLNCCLK